MNLHRHVLHLKLANQRENFGMKSIGAGDANRQVTVQPARDAAGFLQRGVAQREDFAGASSSKASPTSVRLHAPRQASEQRRAHFLFEPFDLLTQEAAKIPALRPPW